MLESQLANRPRVLSLATDATAIIGKAYQLKGDLPLAADYYEKSTQVRSFKFLECGKI